MLYRMDDRSRIGHCIVAAGALTFVLCGCAGSGTADNPDGSSATGSATSGDTGEGTESSTDEADTENPTDGGGGGGETDPSGPDLQLFTLPECNVIPGGALSGADVLTMFVAVRNGGPGDFAALAPVSISSDTGLNASLNSGISTGSSFTAMQVDLASGDYNRTHRFTITVDPNEQTLERDESNNDLQITVHLPDRPDGETDVDCTSP